MIYRCDAFVLSRDGLCLCPCLGLGFSPTLGHRPLLRYRFMFPRGENISLGRGGGAMNTRVTGKQIQMGINREL